jgi:hypothetical protein
VREEAGEEGSCAGEGGADDGDVAFDGGPGGCADVVVWIGVLVWSFVSVGGLYWGDGQVGSVELEMIRRLCRRRMLVIMTL